MMTATLARQLGDPSGPVGRVLARVLNVGNRRTNRAAVDALALVAGERVLDVGFGGGVALRILLAAPGMNPVLGVERSATMLAEARRRFRAELAHGRLELHEGDVAALPLPAGSVDAILSVNTLYFWPDPHAALAELRRVLRPGGRLVLATQPAEALERDPVARGRFRLYADAEIAALLERAGFLASVRRDRGAVLTLGRLSP